MNRFSLCIVPSLLLGTLELKAQSNTERVAHLESTLLKDRQSIQQMHVVIGSRFFRGPKIELWQERKVTIWMDGKAVRSDRLLRIEPAKDFYRETECRNCEKEGYFLFYTEEKLPLPVAISLYPMDKDPDALRNAIIDPRLIGLVLDDTPNLAERSRNHFTSILQRADRRNLTVKSARWRDKESTVVEFELTGCKWRLEFVPECGSNVVSIVCDEETGKTKRRSVVALDLQHIASCGKWFPKTFRIEVESDGKSEYSEVADVEVVSLNEPVPRQVFSLAGMDIKPGTDISTIDNPKAPTGPLFWDGDKVVPLSSKVYESPNTFTRRVMFGASVVFAVGAAMLIWRAYRRHESPLNR